MISPIQVEIIKKILEPFAPKMIGIFGSYARGENTAKSDLDILVEFPLERTVTYFDILELEAILKRKLKIRKIDLVTRGGLHPMILPSVENDLILI